MKFEFDTLYSKTKVNIPDIDPINEKQLARSKTLLDQYVKQWEVVKKMIHKYEYVYTSPFANKNIGNIIPISRSYFKMKEILQEFKLITGENLNIFCMAEAPGGFIQSLLEYSNNINKIGAMTLISEDKSVPYWNKIIKNNTLVQFYKGIHNNGDLCDFKNILSIIQEVGKSSIDILTGDGGFDYSKDYNKQEYNSLPLIYSEIFLALNLQKKGGSFVCKIFDIFLKETIQLIQLLNLSYEKVYIFKPCLSRLSNSEKYLICKGFKGYNQNLVNKLCRSFHSKDLEIDIMYDFYESIKLFNHKYTTNQIKQIEMGMNLIYKKELVKKASDNQIQNAMDWCKKYGVPINNDCFYLKHTIARQRFQRWS